MTTPRVLHLWLQGRHIGEIERLRSGRPRLRFDPESLRHWGVGARPLSYSLPLTPRRVESPELEIYLDNLLPEGALRTQLEREHGVRPGDALGLLAHVGQECAGAVQITTGDELPVPRLRPLTPGEVDRIVLDLPTLTSPDGESITASLGGVQSKVLLTRDGDGWSWPTGGAPSSHLLKPEPADPRAAVPRIIELEHWAMRVAARAGQAVARTEIGRFGGRLTLVVERFDREDGERFHQEDAAQALGIRPGDKYEPAAGEGRLRRLATGPGAEAEDPAVFRDDLLRQVTFRLLVGDGDAHAKNYSLMNRDGSFSVAPAYDVAPVFHVDPRFGDFGMRVDGQRRLARLGREHLVAEAESWGVPRGRARDVVQDVAASVRSALESTADLEGFDLVARVRARVDQVADGT
ncbi:type II toxin-antitoxin system HipA family toxin [Litorihabitans aurantiacus]|uniref:Kinase Y4mE n=1 Tax=Litorihabitans aurantiacus TaxID=1930061 RepID=A0AA37UUJ9_9MICO|nr:HipA domain-containing protein [Litorihabitans aurantiacus]GMA30777.1 putative kinase Y4mE [Litorihabitans aurantiacus]